MTPAYDGLFDVVVQHLARLRGGAANAVDSAAHLAVAAHLRGRPVWTFGTGHSALVAQEVCQRAGGLALFRPIHVAGLLLSDYPYLRGTLLERVPGIAAAVLETTPVERDDVLVVVSNSGRNAVPVELAVGAKDRGLSVVAVTGLATATSEPSREPGGRHLHDVADVVIDTTAPHGDAALTVDGVADAIGPLSTILGSVALHALSARIVELLRDEGVRPPIFSSANVG